MGTGSPLAAVIVMRSRPAVSRPSGLPGMTTPFQRRTARRICIAYSARLKERGRSRFVRRANVARRQTRQWLMGNRMKGACSPS